MSSLLLNSTLPPIFLSGTIVEPDYPQPSRPAGTSASKDSSPGGSSAELASDTYTPSQPTSDPSGISPSALTGYQNYVSPMQQAWQTLGQSLASGDVASAQSALNDYTQNLPGSNLYLSTLTTPSAQFLKDLTNLGTALSEGNLADAQAIFKTAQQDQPQTATQALAAAIAQASSDGASASSWMEDLVGFGTETADPAVNFTSPGYLAGLIPAGNAATSDSQFAGDLANIEDVLMESNANLGDYLRSQGYAAAPVSVYISGLDRVDTLNMLPELADSIGQVNQAESGKMTISNSGSASIEGLSVVTPGAFEETTTGSMNDSFSYDLTKSYTDPGTGIAVVLEHSATLVSGNSTQMTIGMSSSSQGGGGNAAQEQAYEHVGAFDYGATATNLEFLGNFSSIKLDA